MKKKIYYVVWEDGDGEQGWFVRMTPAEAKKVLRFLTAATAKDIIKNPQVRPLEGENVTTAAGIVQEIKERYEIP